MQRRPRGIPDRPTGAPSIPVWRGCIFRLERDRSNATMPQAPRKRPAEPTLFSTSVQPPETNRSAPSYGPSGVSGNTVSLSETFRHSCWRRERRLVYESLKRTRHSLAGQSDFALCGDRAYVYQSATDPDHFRVGGSSCRNRWCLPCARERARIIATNIHANLTETRVRFLTLTLASTDAPLKEQLDKLYRCFALLRKTRCFRKGTMGGVATVEVTYSPGLDRWHPHLHILLSGRYIPHHDLKAEWWRITGDSNILFIKLVHGKAAAANYLSKYISKPLDNLFVNRPERLDEIVIAMRRRRLCLTFGNWRGVALTDQPEPGEWLCMGSLEDVCSDALAGDHNAAKAIRQLAGDNAAELLGIVERNRPPPRTPVPQDVQLLFPPMAAWADPT